MRFIYAECFNSPSHLLTTLVANALPKTLVMVLPISQKTSIAKIKPTPSAGNPNIAPVANTTTKLALGTPAIPWVPGGSVPRVLPPLSSGILHCRARWVRPAVGALGAMIGYESSPDTTIRCS